MSGTKTPRADVRTVKRYAKLFADKQAAEKKVKDIKQQMAALDPLVLEYFQRQGMQRMAVEDGTVHIRRELWAGTQDAVDMDKLIAAAEGTEYISAIAPRMNTQTMSAIMREREAQMKHEGTLPNDIQHVVPEELRPFIKISEVWKVGVRKN